MEPLSRNKKIGIFSLVVLSLALVWLFFTGNLSFLWLKSSVLDQTCTIQGQAAKLPQYKNTILKRDQAQKTLDIVSGEIVVLNKKIAEQKNIIGTKEAQIIAKQNKIVEIDAYLEKNCKNPKGTAITQCNRKKQEKRDLGQDIQILKNAIKTTNNTILAYLNQIKNKQTIITRQLMLIAQYTTFINTYESCDRQLKIKPVLTSPLMSGEAHMSGEVLVSGEVCVSNKVLISGEVHISGEVNVPVYKFSVTQDSPGKAEIELMDFNFSGIDTTTLEISDLFVAEQGSSNILARCSFLSENKEQLRCLPTTKVQVNSETRHYILYAKVKAITGVGSFKVYGAVIAYNGGKGDAIHQTTSLEIKYDPMISCPQPNITVLSPNGGEALELGKYLYPKPFIKYDVKNAPENSWVALSLYKNWVALGYITIGADISYNDGLDWEVGTYVDYIGGPVHRAPAWNDYTIEAMLYTGEKPVGKVPQYPAQKAITFDRSDAVFSLISSAPTCTSGSTYVANSMKPDKCCTVQEVASNAMRCAVAPVCNNNGVCDANEGCTCADCNGQQDHCAIGLVCSGNRANAACCPSGQTWNPDTKVCVLSTPVCPVVIPNGCVDPASAPRDANGCLIEDLRTC